MSEFLLNGQESNSITPANSSQLDGNLLPQTAAYGFDTGHKSTGLAGSFEPTYAPQQTMAEVEPLPTLSTDLTGQSVQPPFYQPIEADQTPSLASSNHDDLTGLAGGEPLLLNSGNTLNSTQQVYGNLDYSDYFNPTRLYAFKDDYLISTQTATAIQINLDSYHFDAYLQLVDPQTGNVLFFDDDGGGGTNAQLRFTAQAGVQYLIRATSYWSYEVGGYSLTAYLNAGTQPTPPDPAPPSEFDSATGYGLVDAATAVAQAVGQSRFGNVADIGGNQWNNDMIQAPEVWAQGYTGQGVTVAVIDSGVDINHEDLRDNIWVNTDEVFGDGIDNDGNGFIDDRYGWNFGLGQNNNNVLPGTNDSGQSHGTHVAGTIAAMENGFGMTGVAHGANIMAIRMGDVFTDSTGGRFVNGGNLAQAIRYAVDNGARVINMSLGWSDNDGAIRDALAYAASRNVITVSSAGNSGGAAPSAPPGQYATDYGVVVGAVDQGRNLANFSNRAGADSRMQYVLAPGVGIYSTVSDPSRFNFSDGTSMAAPHVAGIIALMLSANPNLTHAQVRSILTGTATSGLGQSLATLVEPEVEGDTAPGNGWDLIGPSSLSSKMAHPFNQFFRQEALSRFETRGWATDGSTPATGNLSDGEAQSLTRQGDWAIDLGDLLTAADRPDGQAGEAASWQEDLALPLSEPWVEAGLVAAIA